MSRNSAEWLKTPSFPNSHFVDSRIYTDEGLFKEEQEKSSIRVGLLLVTRVS